MTKNAYELIDSGDFQKLEQIGPYRFVRPSPQAVWRPLLPKKDWENFNARYTRFAGGDGKWSFGSSRPDKNWVIAFDQLKLELARTDFGHLGVFVEQQKNWQRLGRICQPGLKILNLFAYTGASTIACALSGAEVVHVDASKTSVSWARRNADLNGLTDHPIRWMVEDVRKFVGREVRRGNRYDGIILDPPTFGRGTKNEVWKIEEHLPDLLDDLAKLLTEDYCFVLLSSHSPGYTPAAMKNNLLSMVQSSQGSFIEEEMLVAEKNSGRFLPSGASVLYQRS